MIYSCLDAWLKHLKQAYVLGWNEPTSVGSCGRVHEYRQIWLFKCLTKTPETSFYARMRWTCRALDLERLIHEYRQIWLRFIYDKNTWNRCITRIECACRALDPAYSYTNIVIYSCLDVWLKHLKQAYVLGWNLPTSVGSCGCVHEYRKIWLFRRMNKTPETSVYARMDCTYEPWILLTYARIL